MRGNLRTYEKLDANRWGRCVLVLVCWVALFSTGCERVLTRRFSDLFDSSTASEKSKRLATTHIEKGIRHLEGGKLAKAETSFQKALELDPTSAAAHNNLGNLQLSRHDLYGAAWEFERASQLAPTSAVPLINLGMVYEQAGQLEPAAEHYAQAIGLEPRNAVALGNLARVRIKQDWDPLEIHQLLEQVIFHDTREEWLDWADMMRSTHYRFPPNRISDRAKEREPEVADPYGDARDYMNGSELPAPQSTTPLMFPEPIEPIPLGNAIAPTGEGIFTLPRSYSGEDSR